MKLVSVKNLDDSFFENLCVMNDMDADKLLVGEFHLKQILMKNFIINRFEEIDDLEISNDLEQFGIISIFFKIEDEKCMRLSIAEINQMSF